MRLECFNSVDGSTKFQAFMGWYRFVCSNGLIVGITQVDMRRRHIWGLDILDISLLTLLSKLCNYVECQSF
jgi:hypothetical protein